MGKFLDLMKATEEDWAAASDASTPEGNFVFELKQFKKKEETDSLELYFAVLKPLGAFAGEFQASKYRLVTVRFSERNAWLFKQFAKAAGLSLNNVETGLPKVLGKRFTGTIKHSKGTGADGNEVTYVNLNNLAAYSPHTTSVPAAVSEDEDGGEGGMD